ncbi:extracellular solute-binding protein [Streptomyces polygonati]|uniref:Extracellular solute-binding protein n=1 Tax=Streptomyces polygonati TaxID=1617087 RepID=A0ABV8HLU2_9ACTN
MRTLLARLARCALAFGLLVACAACAGGPAGGRTVTIMIPWSGAEFRAFYSVIKDFEKQTGVRVNVEVTRATTQQLDAAVNAGVPPDLAVLPSVGAVTRYADEKLRDRRLQPLQDIGPAGFVQPFSGLMTVRGQVFAVPVKADVKTLIWFDPSVTPRPPTTRAAQLALSERGGRTWCLGLASGPTSGWPGADWIADLLLGGPDGVGTYERWITGQQRWTSAEVRDAWTVWRRFVDGSLGDASVTEFGAAAEGMTADPPTCRLDHGALSAMGFDSGKRQGEDYRFVPPAAGAPLQVSADFVGMFATRNPSATALIEYLAGKEAQTAWVGQSGGYAFSASRDVPRSAYPAGVEQEIAALLQPGAGHILCFTAADMMQPDLSAAFYQAVLNYVADKAQLTTLLGQLDQVGAHLDKDDTPGGKACATPR